jgi:hypothetical protein
MLQGRVALTLGAGLAAALLLVACGDKPIEQLERTGVTAIEQASALACSQDAETLQQAIQFYTELEGKPPADEAALVADGNLREPSKLYDVVNGQIVPTDPGCGSTGAVATTPSGSPPMTAPATDVGEIVTSMEAPLTPQQMLASFTPQEVAEVGGQECAGELASIYVASQKYLAAQGKGPQSLDDLGGYLDQPIDLWQVESDSLVPVAGSGCVALDATPQDEVASCQTEAKTLQIAREAYLAQMGSGNEPTQQDLVDVGFIQHPAPDVDLSNGTVVAVAGGPCDGVDLGL